MQIYAEIGYLAFLMEKALKIKAAELPEAEDLSPERVAEALRSGEADLVCVLGPTASGKTAYAVRLARSLSEICGCGAEIISGDSRQVYRGMDIGTGKDLAEYGEVPYHLIDIMPAGSRYTIFDYQRDFDKAFSDIRSRGAVPILCGGSGLYMEAAASGYNLPVMPADPELRSSLESLSADELRSRLLAIDPSAPKATLENPRRIVRALEVAAYKGENPVPNSQYPPRKTFYIATLVSREERIRRIDARLDARLDEGLVEEVRGLLDSGIKPEDLMYYGLEYKFVTMHVTGLLDYEQMRTLLRNAIHQFAKRQMTWLRGMERRGIRIHWVRP